MKKLLALLLAVMLLLGLCACIAKLPEEAIPSSLQEESTSTAPEETEESTEDQAPELYENLVYTGLAEEREGPYGDVLCYEVPQIDLDDPAIEAINGQIMAEISSLVYADESGAPAYSVIDYEWGCYGGILSIVVHSDHYHYSLPEYYVYNISLETYEPVEDEVLLTSYHLDYYDYLEGVREALAADWLRRAEQAPDNATLDPRTDFYAATQYQTSLTLQNAAESRPYISADGSLMAVVQNYTVAGSGVYWGKYPVGTDYELPGDWTVLGRWAIDGGGE